MGKKHTQFKNLASERVITITTVEHNALSGYKNTMYSTLQPTVEDGWMDERCFRPLLCTVKAELGRGQPGLMR